MLFTRKSNVNNVYDVFDVYDVYGVSGVDSEYEFSAMLSLE